MSTPSQSGPDLPVGTPGRAGPPGCGSVWRRLPRSAQAWWSCCSATRRWRRWSGGTPVPPSLRSGLGLQSGNWMARPRRGAGL